ncbi:MAG: UDP-N-acetylmuramoyl-tripeptide--D-alanyl-D-alanine ligase [Clostridiales bacterium]|nr:UDP-N-acetylmuramoyl-tripeptide--D-alanyl-D-alanine ligase [Clostridiales bacterium]
MKKLTLREIAEATGGTLPKGGEDVTVSEISTDSRKINNNTLFVPLIGERFDAHKFIDDVVKKGAAAFVSDRKTETGAPYVLVKDTTKALGDIAAYYRSLFDISVVGITGSTGKTTTKELTAAVLSAKYKVVKTEGNFNNHIGLPLTVFNIDETTEAAVLEMGMNHFGEISYLGKIAKPNAALITNVGVSHIEYLGSREGILKAKCEIFESLKPGGEKILNGECDMLSTLRGKEENTCFYGFDAETCDVYAEDIEYVSLSETRFTAVIKGERVKLTLKNAPGRHMVLNALGAAAVGHCFGLSPDEIKKGIEAFKPGDKRLNIIDTARYTLINDTYNANPQSVKAGLDVIAPLEGRSVAILGEMFELGEDSPKYHREVGEYAAKAGIDIVVGIGNENVMQLTLGASFGGVKKVFYYENKEDFYNNIKKIFKPGDTVLIKASRGAKFEEITEKLVKKGNAPF